jgi:L-lysine 2,3-aminomutase
LWSPGLARVGHAEHWNDLTAIQQKTLVAVITEQGVNLQSQKVMLTLGMRPSTVRRALEALVARDIL